MLRPPTRGGGGGGGAGVNFMEKTICIRNTEITFSIWDLGGARRRRRGALRCALTATLRAGQKEFINMLPLVCNDAVAILFMFDLSRKSTLNSVREWYRQARGFNKVGGAAVATAPAAPRSLPWLNRCARLLDGHLVPCWDEVRLVRELSARGTGGNHATGTLRARRRAAQRAVSPQRPTHAPAHAGVQARRYAKAMKAPLIFCSTSLSINVQKIFKVVLSKAFDLKCTIEPITNVGEPIFEY